MSIRFLPFVVAAAAVAWIGCSSEAVAPSAEAPSEFQKQLQLQLLEAAPGDVIEIPAGRFALDRSLTLNVDGVTLRGAGMEQTVLDFEGQVAGAEGLLVNASDFTIEDLAIEDTRGDALKVNEGRNIVIRRVRTEWTRGPHVDNGMYGIYPVQTENTLVEGCVAIGASDAGIYVGQSRNVVVRDNRAEYNVAGIEIENTIGADVYDNVAIHNTGGILVFNMPDLPQPGHSTRVYRNRVVENNTDNFGAEGTTVASIPAGSGVIVNSNDKVEIFDNEIADNRTGNVIITSYFTADYAGEREMAEQFDPYPESIFVYENRFSGGGDSPDHLELKALRLARYGLTGSFPDILWDGVVNPERADAEGPVLCVDNGDSKVLNFDAGNGYAGITEEMSGHRCAQPKLDPIVLPHVEA